MADGRRYPLNPQLDIGQILLEAKSRWLRPSEVCEILRNYQKFHLTPDPPYRPPGGSLFLFDRKALRYFRKDGHHWRKKKDGKTVREAHEKLKSGSVDVLHCYYAHGEDNENFQRRSYWMLDGHLEHIVLVHYREVNEGSRPGISRLSNANPRAQNHPHGDQTAIAAQVSYASSPSNVEWNAQTPSSECEDADSGDDIGTSSLSEPVSGSEIQNTCFPTNDATNENMSGCSSSVSHSHAGGLVHGVGLYRSLNPFFVNQVVSQNCIPIVGQQTIYGTSQEAGFPEREHLGAGSFDGASICYNASLATWPDILSLNSKMASVNEQKGYYDQPNDTNIVSRKVTESSLDASNIPDIVTRNITESSLDASGLKYGIDGNFNFLCDAHLQTIMRDDPRLLKEVQNKKGSEHGAHVTDDKQTNHIYQAPHDEQIHAAPLFKNNGRSRVNVTASDQRLLFESEDSYSLKNASVSGLQHDGEEERLKKLDSFGRWMNNEIGKDCDDSLMASDSGNYWNTLDAQNEDKEVSSLSHHMQLDANSVGPSLSQEQLFSILDFSPSWAYSGVATKILIAGTFLGGIKASSVKWGCMFGELEVSAEVLAENVLRCHVPAHAPGQIPFYITCSNRLACSEIREFEYRENSPAAKFSVGRENEPKDEISLQVHFAKMLSLGVDRKMLLCHAEKCHTCSIKRELFSMLSDDEVEWNKTEKGLKAFNVYSANPRDALIQNLLKSKLYDWLVCKAHEEGKGPNVLDEEGQGVLHLAAGLGYEWAMCPIINAGVSPSFRDVHGWTGLHWAAYFGKEETVATLVRLGAAPGAVEDPTSKFPEGRTAADLASSRGHKGIAGFLAEADLTSHLSSLTVKDSVMNSVSATLAAEKAFETAEEQNIAPLDGDGREQLALRGSLAAVRNSAQAAARIQAAFRVHSFCQRQLIKDNNENSEISSQLAYSSLNSKSHKTGHFNDSSHMAAVKIQQKYRGWKGRSEFLKIRNRIVKIQAHVRGHQVRKQYKRVVWSVGIVEKAILRWRRKGAGLRGFRAEKSAGDVQTEVGKTDEYDFLHLGRRQKVAGVEKALARVQSMVRYPEARDQYMRLVASSQKSKLEDGAQTSDQVQSSVEESKGVEGEGLPSPMID